MQYLPGIKGANRYNSCYRRRLFEKEFQKFWIHLDYKWSISAPYHSVPSSNIHKYLMNGDYHNRYGPAVIQYSTNGERLAEAYWIHDKQLSYSQFQKYVQMSRYSRK